MKRLLVILSILPALIGCYQGQPSPDPPVHLNPSMFNQQKLNPQSPDPLFADGAGMRTPPSGTVARGFLREDSIYYTGLVHDTTPVEMSPVPTTLAVLKRGQERFNIYCSPCHSRIGDGKGMIVQRGLNPPPPSFHDDRLLRVGDGHFFHVMTEGIRTMPPYKYQVRVDDRWAIVAYIRALQRSERATEKDVPIELRGTVK
ncbi:quinol:cytochrome C oxidoreductase [candidate division GN15 bacterium]|uniref:Quinol:cytochrome C oxidoreductase n=1 Tax=candidate division GN15 bacterium TaxID=2072418 RepID=A0A855X1Z9_9BACT|nr:MAG: quinol:cytochrome C oxidoreductase [candidate division GN15 bacterium]